MPKEEDPRKDEGNKDAKEERSQDAVEEAVRKRVRANTPSPHRGNTPQGETHCGLDEVIEAGFSVLHNKQQTIRFHTYLILSSCW